MRRIYPLIFTLFCFLSVSAQKQNVEIIWIFPSESDSILVYYHVSTHFPSIERSIAPFPHHGIKYMVPNEVSIDSLKQSMSIEGGSFSLVEIKSKKALISQTPEGLSLFKNKAPVEIEDDFDLASFIWILPESAEFRDFQSSSRGSFTRRGNTLLFTAKKVNQLKFEILFREQPPQSIQATATPSENPGQPSTPGSAPPQKPSPDTLFTTSIAFETSQYALSSGDLEILQKVLESTKKHPHSNILVTGHTDEVPFIPGSQSNNWELSARRATTVINALIQSGIPEAQIRASFFSNTHGNQRQANIYLLAK